MTRKSHLLGSPVKLENGCFSGCLIAIITSDPSTLTGVRRRLPRSFAPNGVIPPVQFHFCVPDVTLGSSGGFFQCASSSVWPQTDSLAQQHSAGIRFLCVKDSTV